MKSIVLALGLISFSVAGADYGYLKPEDQKYYKNDSFDGNNQRERIDSLVKEVNKLHGDVSSLKSTVEQLRRELDEMKSKK